MVSAADKDKSGYLDKEEFLALVARKWEHLEEVSDFAELFFKQKITGSKQQVQAIS